MKIVHLCLQAPYNDYWGYQDNLLPKYQRKQGHDVTVITTNTMHENGKVVTVDTADYLLNDGQRIIRLDHQRYKPERLSNVFRIYRIYDLLTQIRPDFIMVHGLGNFSILQAASYIKNVNPKCNVVADNHMDYCNGKALLSLQRLPLRILYRFLNRRMQKYYSIVYGITPWRIQYMQEVFGIRKSKSRLLVVGGDDDKIDIPNREKIAEKIRADHNIDKNDFLIVTGGKIDKTKNIHLLMKAISNINRENVKLIVFGEPNAAMEQEFEKLAYNPNIRAIGWIAAEEAYNYFLAADLVVFPGTHSVMWEQACACAVPCIFKHWEGMHHVDIGGNCEFLYNDSVAEIESVLIDIIDDKEKYCRMKHAAQKGITEFSYNEIAKRAIEVQ